MGVEGPDPRSWLSSTTTSLGSLGAVRGLWHTRTPLEAMGAFVYPEMFGIPRAQQAFDESGNFLDAKNRARLEELLKDYLKYAVGLKPLA